MYFYKIKNSGIERYYYFYRFKKGKTAGVLLTVEDKQERRKTGNNLTVTGKF